MENAYLFLLSLTAIGNIFSIFIFFAIYFILKGRTKDRPDAPSVQYWTNYFLNMGIFVTILFIPYLVAFFDTSDFLTITKWALIIGRAFLLLAVSSTARLLALFVWKQKVDLVYFIWVLLGSVIFILGIIYPTGQIFDRAEKLLINQSHPFVGTALPIYIA